MWVKFKDVHNEDALVNLDKIEDIHIKRDVVSTPIKYKIEAYTPGYCGKGVNYNTFTLYENTDKTIVYYKFNELCKSLVTNNIIYSFIEG